MLRKAADSLQHVLLPDHALVDRLQRTTRSLAWAPARPAAAPCNRGNPKGGPDREGIQKSTVRVPC